MEMKKKVTMKDIAKETGLSKSTVSRALSGNAQRVKQETIDIVLEKASEMGYECKAVKLARAKTIAVLVPEVKTLMYEVYSAHVDKILREKGYNTLNIISRSAPDVEIVHIAVMLQNEVAGVLLCPSNPSENVDTYINLLEEDVPLVLYDRTMDELPVPKVRTDDYEKVYMLMEYLIRIGRKRIVHLAGEPNNKKHLEQIRAYRDVMEKHQCPVDSEYIIYSDGSVESGEEAMGKFLKKQLPFDAVFGFCDNAALGAKRFLEKLHYSIPDDVAICAMSGVPFLPTIVTPMLTVIEQSYEEMAKKSVELLLEKLENPDIPDKEIVLESKIIIRGTTEKNKK